MKGNDIHIMFSGGGTGGHLFPGLAVAEALTAAVPRLQVTFCGVGKSFERTHVQRAGFNYIALPARPTPGGPRETLAFLMENVAGYFAARRILREQRVDAVIGLGGYASVPMARAALSRRVPLILLEQNAVAGRATRWLASRAALVCTSFPHTIGLPARCRVRFTGNPVRFFRGEGRETKGEGRFKVHASKFKSGKSPNPQSQILILGGSNGAQSLNENVPRALYKIRNLLAGWRIVHQSGQAHFEATQELYAKLGLPAEVAPFLADVPEILQNTDLAVCRAGGTTLAELALAGVPAVLLPYPRAAKNHQMANARYYSSQGGCVTIDELDTTGRLDDRVAEILCFLLSNIELRHYMAAAMRRLACPNAAENAADLIWSIISTQPRESVLAAA